MLKEKYQTLRLEFILECRHGVEVLGKINKPMMIHILIIRTVCHFSNWPLDGALR